MSVVIRAYEARDRDTVTRLVGEVLVEHGFTRAMGGIECDLAEARYVGARAAFWVAERGGEVIGTVAIRPKDASTAELKRLYLRRDARGLGAGQLLYAHAEAFARGAGYESLWLESSRRFARAHALYERNGFVLLARLENDWEDNLYEKRLVPR